MLIRLFVLMGLSFLLGMVVGAGLATVAYALQSVP